MSSKFDWTKLPNKAAKYTKNYLVRKIFKFNKNTTFDTFSQIWREVWSDCTKTSSVMLYSMLHIENGCLQTFHG